MTENIQSVWIDNKKRAVFTKKISGCTQMYFSDKEKMLKAVCILLAKGYKLG